MATPALITVGPMHVPCPACSADIPVPVTGIQLTAHRDGTHTLNCHPDMTAIREHLRTHNN